ncbi:MAG: hypothetical protein AAF316_00330 [Cyanobacteria bacterium P01_A01_bin.80]
MIGFNCQKNTQAKMKIKKYKQPGLISEHNRYKVDHLFLLIGEDESFFCNYAAANFLLKEEGKPLLVYSERMEKVANRLKEELIIGDNSMIALDNSHENGFEIKKRITEKIKEIQKEHPDKNKFGLNYTGGTKTMIAHAYQALISYEFEHHPVFSYLDPSGLEMLIERDRGNPIPFKLFLEP